MKTFLSLLWCVLSAAVVCHARLLDKKKEVVHQFNENITHLKSTLDIKSLNSFEGMYRDENGISVYLRRVATTLSVSGIASTYKQINTSTLFQLYDLIDFTKNTALNKWPTVKNLRRRHSFESMRYLPSTRDTLLVYTTCNHVNMSIHSLESISSSPDQFDILVIDDHSVDGTFQILTKKGFSVISKPVAKGLTDSWNIGYHIAKLLKYQYIIFSNNDVLVPHGTIEIVRASLKDEALVVPLTTKKGAGHNPTQSIETQYDIDPALVPIFNNPSNFQLVQDMLTSLHNSSDPKNQKLISSKYKGKQKFNGFFFAINLEKIESSAYSDTNLFDPNNVMVEQEDTLMASMAKHKVYPKICKFLFVYHYKSVTVKAAGSTGRSRNNLVFFHPEISSNQTVASSSGPGTSSSSSSSSSTSTSTTSGLTGVIAGHTDNASATAAAIAPVDNSKEYHKYYHFLSQLMEMDRTYTPNKDTSPKIIAFVLPPPISRALFMAEKNEFGGNNFSSTQICMTPNSETAGRRTGRGHRKHTQHCCNSKVHQDLAAVIHFGQSLHNLFDVRIKYLHDDSLVDDDWYDLACVDLVINLAIGAYQLEQAYNLKSTLIKVAWITDMFVAWNDIKAVGNYDLVLAPSEYARDYIRSLTALPSLCLVKCPRYLSWAHRQSQVLVEVFPPFPLMNYSAGPAVSSLDMDFVVDVQDVSMEAVGSRLAEAIGAKTTWGVLKRSCKKSIIWKHIDSGRKQLMHESVQLLLRSVKVFVVKISSVSLFNGMDPFILDCLLSGAWVLVYQPLPQPRHAISTRLPMFDNVEALAIEVQTLISFGNASASVKKSKHNSYELIRQEILEDSSSFARAALLSATLKKAGMMSINTLPFPIPEGNIDTESFQTVCIGITTAPFKFDGTSLLAVRSKITSLIQQFVESKHRQGKRLRIYVLQPLMSSERDIDSLKEVIEACEKVVLSLGVSQLVATTLYWNHFHVTEDATKKGARVPAAVDDIDDFLAHLRLRSRCDWCMLSHLDWTHTSLWMDSILPLLSPPSTKVIVWDLDSVDPASVTTLPSHLDSASTRADIRVLPWALMFRLHALTDTKPRFVNIESSLSRSKVKEVRSIYDDFAFAASLTREMSREDIVFLRAGGNSQLMIHSSKTGKKGGDWRSGLFHNYFTNLITNLHF